MIGIPAPKKDIHIRLDADVVDWFKARGRGYQTRIPYMGYTNSSLRSIISHNYRASFV